MVDRGFPKQVGVRKSDPRTLGQALGQQSRESKTKKDPHVVPYPQRILGLEQVGQN